MDVSAKNLSFYYSIAAIALAVCVFCNENAIAARFKNVSALNRNVAAKSGMPAARAIADSDRSIKVRGQNRNFSMLLTIKSEKDKVRFGEIRDSYKKEIIRTRY